MPTDPPVLNALPPHTSQPEAFQEWRLGLFINDAIIVLESVQMSASAGDGQIDQGLPVSQTILAFLRIAGCDEHR